MFSLALLFYHLEGEDKMKAKQKAKISLEQQLVQIGTYSGTMLCSGVLYETLEQKYK